MPQPTLVSDVTLPQPGVKTQEHFKWGDENIVVSTVDLGQRFDAGGPAERAIMEMGDMAGAMLGKPTRDPHADDSEETMAFYADEDGVIRDYAEITVAHGAGSRQKVLDRLADLEVGSYGDVA